MTEEGKDSFVAGNPQSRYYYGTFQGVANYYPPAPPPPPHPVVGFPQPVAPHGYTVILGIIPMDIITVQQVMSSLKECPRENIDFHAVVWAWDGSCGIPWYVGTFVLLCVQVDYREKPGYVACAIAFHQYQVVGRGLPTETDEHPKIYRMKLWATNEVRAKSKFWYFLRKLKKVKKSNGQVLAINEIFEKNPTKIKNYGIWLRYQSRTGYHNMYKEYRDTTLNGAVEQMYNEMASRHRVRFPCIQIIKTATIPAKLCKRESTKQFHNSKIKFPLVFKKVSPKMKSDVALHGVLLWLSMGFLAPLGILIIRMSHREKGGSRGKVFFYLHVILQALSVLLVTSGAIMSMKSFENSFDNNHQRIGVALYGVVWVQAVIGFLRPHSQTTSWVGPEGRVYHSHDGLAPHSHEPIYSPGYFSRRAPPILTRDFNERAFTVGIGGPVGTGKTALMLAICKFLRDKYSLAAVTNDIFTKEDGEFLIKHGALPEERIRAVETGGCPHAAIREDISINLGPLEELSKLFKADLLLCESGGDNLAANFSRELADYIYIIDVSGGDKIPRKGGPGITQADLLVINKTDLAPAVGADLAVMERDALRIRDGGPFVFAQIKHGLGVEEIVNHILQAWEGATGKKQH
ncbi:hypothetical protein GH714_005111 [Hevea brasiliensis]|uniref:Urease accessory protein G n=1 Tax=Hevea brasiliensis TaxID=3981 RepID=A0A6A6M0E9_HEVBR|nr:hypothetical protein GH714_005111 [Hevea brasiliensis]